jgi:hypothetical protein
MLFIPYEMKSSFVKWNEITLLDTATIAGVTAVFLALATPLMRGAILRQRTAECARKIMLAAEAFDFYAASVGIYPPGPGVSTQADRTMLGIFSTFHIDWWTCETELGGRWNWHSGGRDACSIVISGPGISERRMAHLDALLDDGDLNAGAFKRRGPDYFYIIKKQDIVRNNLL